MTRCRAWGLKSARNAVDQLYTQRLDWALTGNYQAEFEGQLSENGGTLKRKAIRCSGFSCSDEPLAWRAG